MAEAYHFYRGAAEKGHGPAMNAVGFMLTQGIGVTKDVVQGTVWLRRAADSGQSNAMQTLSAIYAQGAGVPQDLGRAYFWVQLALKTYPANDQHRSGAETLSQTIATHLTPAQIKSTDNEVMAWKPTAPTPPT
jgi:hypothetical protein